MKIIRNVMPVILTVLLVACSTSLSSPTAPALPVEDPPLENPAPAESLTGLWSGTTITPSQGTFRTDFDLTQNGNEITGNISIFPRSGLEISTQLTGEEADGSVTLIAEIGLGNPGEEQEYRFTYQGTLSDATLSGQVSVQPLTGTVPAELGTFTTTESTS